MSESSRKNALFFASVAEWYPVLPKYGFQGAGCCGSPYRGERQLLVASKMAMNSRTNRAANGVVRRELNKTAACSKPHCSRGVNCVNSVSNTHRRLETRCSSTTRKACQVVAAQVATLWQNQYQSQVLRNSCQGTLLSPMTLPIQRHCTAASNFPASGNS